MNTRQDTPSVTYITKETHVNADIHCKNDIRIAGTIAGEVESHQKLILSSSGKVKGTIFSPVAEIAGKVEGDIRVSNKLTLRPTASVDGSIYAKKITIEDGAQLKGSFHVGPDIDITNGQSRNTARPDSESKIDSKDTEDSKEKTSSNKDNPETSKTVSEETDSKEEDESSKQTSAADHKKKKKSGSKFKSFKSLTS